VAPVTGRSHAFFVGQIVWLYHFLQHDLPQPVLLFAGCPDPNRTVCPDVGLMGCCGWEYCSGEVMAGCSGMGETGRCHFGAAGGSEYVTTGGCAHLGMEGWAGGSLRWLAADISAASIRSARSTFGWEVVRAWAGFAFVAMSAKLPPKPKANTIAPIKVFSIVHSHVQLSLVLGGTCADTTCITLSIQRLL
jgi:hypothetical protein